ncbi:hypothetical protein ACSCBZ_13115 [Streptomyces niveiscabiei]
MLPTGARDVGERDRAEARTAALMPGAAGALTVLAVPVSGTTPGRGRQG